MEALAGWPEEKFYLNYYLHTCEDLYSNSKKNCIRFFLENACLLARARIHLSLLYFRKEKASQFIHGDCSLRPPPRASASGQIRVVPPSRRARSRPPAVKESGASPSRQHGGDRSSWRQRGQRSLEQRWSWRNLCIHRLRWQSRLESV